MDIEYRPFADIILRSKAGFQNHMIEKRPMDPLPEYIEFLGKIYVQQKKNSLIYDLKE